MLTRILLLGIVIALAIMLYRKIKRAQQTKASSTGVTPAMRKCAHCGVHLPEPDAIRSGDHFYCSEQHRLLHEREQDRHD